MVLLYGRLDFQKPGGHASRIKLIKDLRLKKIPQKKRIVSNKNYCVINGKKKMVLNSNHD